jgi:hypothetical protein
LKISKHLIVAAHSNSLANQQRVAGLMGLQAAYEEVKASV